MFTNEACDFFKYGIIWSCSQPLKGKTIIVWFRDVLNSEGVARLCHPFGITKPNSFDSITMTSVSTGSTRRLWDLLPMTNSDKPKPKKFEPRRHEDTEEKLEKTPWLCVSVVSKNSCTKSKHLTSKFLTLVITHPYTFKITLFRTSKPGRFAANFANSHGF